MLFNSYEFVFAFLPVVLIGFFLTGKRNHELAATGLAVASIFFYGWWNIKIVPILLLSILVNYFFGKKVTPSPSGLTTPRSEHIRRATLYLALALNLSLLGLFKYANFFIENTNYVLRMSSGEPIKALDIVMPIGISFFTFTQIAFIIDCWQGKVRERKFTHYLLFVTYFPHLIAGPVIHHAQMMPQFSKPGTYFPNYNKIAVGIVIFTIGLTKKILIADPISTYADSMFGAVAGGASPHFFEAWLGILAYTFQIYFDFSGYSDMAIGLSLLFGIHLPINFNSPYKATSIIDFWRRWHISLSTFLRDYLYIPLGGNLRGKVRRYLNLFATMLLGGLWHGANWTFLLWGAAHGVLLIINHGWRNFVGDHRRSGRVGGTISWIITFVSVCFTWVLFRADSLTSAINVYKGMLGLNGMAIPPFLASRLPSLHNIQVAPIHTSGEIGHIFALLGLSFLICLGLPNLNKLPYPEASQPSLKMMTNWKIAPVYAGLFLFCVLNFSNYSPFLYFQF